MKSRRNAMANSGHGAGAMNTKMYKHYIGDGYVQWYRLPLMYVYFKST